MVAHEKRNSAQLFCAVPTRNDLALSSLLFPAQPTQKLGYPRSTRARFPLSIDGRGTELKNQNNSRYTYFQNQDKVVQYTYIYNKQEVSL